MDHSGATGIVASPSGYTTNTRPGPVHNMHTSMKCDVREMLIVFEEEEEEEEEDLLSMYVNKER